jgi:MFS family permease
MKVGQLGRQPVQTGDHKEEGARPSATRRRYILGLLTSVYILNFMDRSILGVVLDPIKKEFGLSDTMMGLMIGPGFALIYAVLGIPIARYADNRKRLPLIAAGLTFWSVMTALCGMAQNAWQIFITRLGVGIGESTGASPGQSIISDIFPKNRRPVAFSIYHLSPAMGLYAALLIGGVATHYLGWRAAFFIAGIPGLVIAALLYFTVKEPVRGFSDGPKVDTRHYNIRQTLHYLITNRTFLLCVAAELLAAFVNFTMAGWMPSFLRRVHHMNSAEIGVYAGTVKAVLGASGALVGGFVVSAVSKHNDRLKLLLPATAVLLGGPALTLFLLANSLPVALVGLGLMAFCVASHQGSVIAVIQTVLKVRMRAFGSGLSLLLANLLCYSTASLLVGVLNDSLKGHFGTEAVRYSMLIAVIAAVLAAISLLMASRYVRRDISRAMEETMAETPR